MVSRGNLHRGTLNLSHFGCRGFIIPSLPCSSRLYLSVKLWFAGHSCQEADWRIPGQRCFSLFSTASHSSREGSQRRHNHGWQQGFRKWFPCCHVDEGMIIISIWRLRQTEFTSLGRININGDQCGSLFYQFLNSDLLGLSRAGMNLKIEVKLCWWWWSVEFISLHGIMLSPDKGTSSPDSILIRNCTGVFSCHFCAEWGWNTTCLTDLSFTLPLGFVVLQVGLIKTWPELWLISGICSSSASTCPNSSNSCSSSSTCPFSVSHSCFAKSCVFPCFTTFSCEMVSAGRMLGFRSWRWTILGLACLFSNAFHFTCSDVYLAARTRIRN